MLIKSTEERRINFAIVACVLSFAHRSSKEQILEERRAMENKEKQRLCAVRYQRRALEGPSTMEGPIRSKVAYSN